jgi:hypothetical protein
MNLEAPLLALLTCDPANMLTVLDMKLGVEVFETPLNSAVFSYIMEHWNRDQKLPTKLQVEHDWPGFTVESDVQETVVWLVEALQKRFLVNQSQDAIRKAAISLWDDPAKSLRELTDDIGQALAGGGKSREEGPRVWDALDLNPAEQPRWLASRRLPRAAVTLLLGDEGIGKSIFWVMLVAHITTGKPFAGFGIPTREPQCVVLVLTEDDWSKDVRPRLELAGADLGMIKVICSEKDGSGSPVFPRDIHRIDAIDPHPALVVVDCWLDTVSPGQRISDPQQAREALHPWRDLATRIDAGVRPRSISDHMNLLAAVNRRVAESDERRAKAEHGADAVGTVSPVCHVSFVYAVGNAVGEKFGPWQGIYNWQPGDEPVPFAMPFITNGIDTHYYMSQKMVEAFENSTVWTGADPDEHNKHLKRRP